MFLDHGERHNLDSIRFVHDDNLDQEYRCHVHDGNLDQGDNFHAHDDSLDLGNRYRVHDGSLDLGNRCHAHDGTLDLGDRFRVHDGSLDLDNFHNSFAVPFYPSLLFKLAYVPLDKMGLGIYTSKMNYLQ